MNERFIYLGHMRQKAHFIRERIIREYQERCQLCSLFLFSMKDAAKAYQYTITVRQPFVTEQVTRVRKSDQLLLPKWAYSKIVDGSSRLYSKHHCIRCCKIWLYDGEPYCNACKEAIQSIGGF